MIALLFYLFILPVSLLPFPLLYLCSDFCYFIIYYIVPYRKNLVLQNLRNAFPDKNEREIKEISKRFYRYFCDFALETVKTFTLSEKSLMNRFTVKNPELLQRFFDNQQSLIAATGHYGNWEWAAMALARFFLAKTGGIYKPLQDRFSDRKVNESRSRLGFHLVPIAKVKQYYSDNKDKLLLTCYITDQSPNNIYRCHWMRFLNQDTPVMLGAERYAKMYNHPIVYGHIRPVRRGHYEVEFSVISEKPQEEKQLAITEKHTRFLEQIITAKPEYWLWTHRRWKHQRPEGKYKKTAQAT